MIKTFTSNDVTRYFFGELSKDEKIAIEEAIAYDSQLQDVYANLAHAEDMLKVTFTPKKSTTDAILAYSKHFGKAIN